MWTWPLLGYHHMNAPEDKHTSEIKVWINKVGALTKIKLGGMFTVMDYLSNKFVQPDFFHSNESNENGRLTDFQKSNQI